MKGSCRWVAAACATMLVAGCIRPAAAPEALPEAVSGPAASPLSLAGHWRVAGIDGSDFDEPYGLALESDGKAIWWNPRCAGQVVPYRIEGSVFLPDAAPSAQPRPVCAIAVPHRLPDVVQALRSGTRIARTASNGIEIHGGGHSLLLYSQ